MFRMFCASVESASSLMLCAAAVCYAGLLQLSHCERTPYTQADNAVRDTCIKKRSDLQSEYDRKVKDIVESGGDV